MFDGFQFSRVDVGDAVIRAAVGGSGPPLLLLHGCPQTLAMWHLVAPRLAEEFTVVAADLRGYGESTAPHSTADHTAYSKRAMALDQVAVMRSFGFDSFAIAGHDRGARCAYRMALDHPETVTKLAVLDIIPTGEAFRRADMAFGFNFWHWFFLAQPPDLPERFLASDLEHGWLGRACSGSAPDALEDFRNSWKDPDTIRAICEDFRAGATFDFALDEADRGTKRISCPTLALWGSRGAIGGRYDVLDVWSEWADDVRGRSLECGHFLPEEEPEETATELASFFRT